MIERLEWDSKFWGKEIFSLSSDFVESDRPCNQKDLEVLDYDIIQCSIPIHEKTKINYLEKNGFRYQDTRILLEKNIDRNEVAQSTCKIAEEKDIATLRHLADGLFTCSRFSSYPYDSKKASRFYQTWIENAVLGSFDDLCIIISCDNLLSGFITLRSSGEVGTIGLLGVARHQHRSGLGSQLVLAANQYFRGIGVNKIQVATQGKNISALNFYTNNKFKTVHIDMWMCLYR